MVPQITNNRIPARMIHKATLMKSISSIEDVERLAAFNRIIFPDEESVARLLRSLVLDHPNTVPDYFLFIENESEKRIVSSISLHIAVLVFSLGYPLLFDTYIFKYFIYETDVELNIKARFNLSRLKMF